LHRLEQELDIASTLQRKYHGGIYSRKGSIRQDHGVGRISKSITWEEGRKVRDGPAFLFSIQDFYRQSSRTIPQSVKILDKSHSIES
jgi:hypothetical protein